jgi:hypothetical protein
MLDKKLENNAGLKEIVDLSKEANGSQSLSGMPTTCSEMVVVLWPVRAGAPLRPPKLLAINGSGAHDRHILYHNHYKSHCRCLCIE